MAETKKPAPKGDTSLGGGLYRDDRGSSKTYIFRGRVNNKQVRKALRRPETGDVATADNTTLTEARRFLADMKADAANGGTRHFAHIEAKTKPGDFTVAQAWEAYMKHARNEVRGRTYAVKENHWTRFLAPAWGDRPIRTITRRDCMELLSTIRMDYEAKGQQGTTVNVLHSNLGAFFDWCLSRFEYRVEANPMRDVPRPVKEQPDPPRPLDVSELKAFFSAAAVVSQTRPRAVQAVELLLRSACRRNEIFDARWSWVREDGLLIPADKAKNGCAILVPLTDGMRALIGEQGSAKDSDPIFGANPRWTSEAIDLIRAEMGLDQHWTGHDLRDTFMTRMEEPMNEDDLPRFPMEVRDACLNHRPSGVGAARYHGTIKTPRWFYAQRRAALNYWNRWLDELKAEALEQRQAA